MSLYGNFTLKEWLALHCATKDVDDLFRKALKDNDEPMAVLALAELVKRGDIDLVTYALRDAVDTGCITLGSHFSTVLANALTNFGDRDPINDGEHYNLIIRDGEILNPEEMDNFLSILDAEGIADPLPAFDGKELDLYTLIDGKWASPDGSKEDFFYVSYYSVE